MSLRAYAKQSRGQGRDLSQHLLASVFAPLINDVTHKSIPLKHHTRNGRLEKYPKGKPFKGISPASFTCTCLKETYPWWPRFMGNSFDQVLENARRVSYIAFSHD